MKRTSIIIAIAVLIAFAGVASAQVSGTKHDLRTLTGQTEICVTCHAPHLPDAALTTPLWNHTLSTQTYQTYTSPTMDSTPGGLGSGTVSDLCLSCHDGTVATGSYYNGPTPTYTVGTWSVDATGVLTGTPDMCTDLRNDHPVDMTYTAAHPDVVSGDLEDPGTIALPLFDPTVQRATCHDAHDATNTPCLVVTNDASNLCLECHIK